MSETETLTMISIIVRLDPIARETLRRDALHSRSVWDQNHAFRATEAAKAEALAMWAFWTAILAALDDADQQVETLPVDLSDKIKIGIKIVDNDPRMPNRIRFVTAIEGSRVRAAMSMTDGTGETMISRKFIHTDGKPRRSGWSLVP